MNSLDLLNRGKPLFVEDLIKFDSALQDEIANSSFLILGGAGSIGQAVTKEIFKRQPKKLYIVDLSENNLVELVRDIRSSFGYIKGDFQTFALDIGSWQFDAFMIAYNEFDYILNLSALKHVRSEKDPFTLMRMIETNIINTKRTLTWAKNIHSKKYFAVSTDKAANPANLMGASKRIMELILLSENNDISISTSRFANVAFSDGSLLHGFEQRLLKRQPLVAPNDVKRYFVTQEESGIICLFSSIFGANCDIYFPKLNESHLQSFSDLAVLFLKSRNLEPLIVSSETEARDYFTKNNLRDNKWPCLFVESDTTGEKKVEEFFTKNEIVDFNSYEDFGIIKNTLNDNCIELDSFFDNLEILRNEKNCNKNIILNLFKNVLPDFVHDETGKYLDSKM